MEPFVPTELYILQNPESFGVEHISTYVEVDSMVYQ